MRIGGANLRCCWSADYSRLSHGKPTVFPLVRAGPVGLHLFSLFWLLMGEVEGET